MVNVPGRNEIENQKNKKKSREMYYYYRII